MTHGRWASHGETRLISSEAVFVASTALVILMNIACFTLGYLTIRLGYKLIDAGVKGGFKFSASLGGAKANLASVSRRRRNNLRCFQLLWPMLTKWRLARFDRIHVSDSGHLLLLNVDGRKTAGKGDISGTPSSSAACGVPIWE